MHNYSRRDVLKKNRNMFNSSLYSFINVLNLQVVSVRIALPYLLCGRSATSVILAILGIGRIVCFLEVQTLTTLSLTHL